MVAVSAHVAMMEQRIFDQLDRLERGARIETRPERETYNDSSAEYSAYDGSRAQYSQDPHYYDAPNFEDQPVRLDSFGE